MPLYLTTLWLHIVAIISWMAGILYLYRLFINHRERGIGKPDVHELLCLMEFRLYRYITLPAMIASIVLGFLLILQNLPLAHSLWFAIKFVSVLALVFWTLYAGRLLQRAKTDPLLLPSARTLRFMNEIPTLLMLIIVAMVVFKPFS